MKLTTHVIDAMLAAGCTAEQIGAAVKAAMREDDESHADRRERDRIRKREQRAREKYNENNDRVRDVTRTDADGADTLSPEGSSPTPPSPKPLSPKENPPKGGQKKTPKSELMAVLDEERAAAVVEHRQRLRKPLTAHAAELLAKRLAGFPDPNAAADRMIEKGWQSIEPDWNGAHQPRGSPSKPPSSRSMLKESIRLAEMQENEDREREGDRQAFGRIRLIGG